MAEATGGAVSQEQTAASRYEHLSTEREPYLTRARECAVLTIPHLIREDGTRNGEELYRPFQSVGARGINNLASKLLLALFPPGTSFFRISVDPLIAKLLKSTRNDPESVAFETELESELARVESSVVNRFERRGVRANMIEAFKHLFVAGNVLLEVFDDGGCRLHHLDTYVVRRDYEGTMLEIILKETLHVSALDPDLRKMVEENDEIETSDRSADGEGDEYDLFTWIRRSEDGSKYEISQELGGVAIDESEDSDPLDTPRFHALRLNKTDGEDYSRSFVDDYFGDLYSLEMLCKANVEYSGAVSRIIGFVKPESYTDKDQVAKAASGTILDGEARDVSILSFAEKTADMSMADKQAVRIEQRLEQAFLLFSSVQRNAERVTAEEIRTVVNELEQGLGGVYSVMSQELQTPLINRYLHIMQKNREIPKEIFEDQLVQPQIIGGLAGLSRNSDLMKYRQLASELANTFGQEVVAEYLHPGVYIKSLMSGLGITNDELVRSDEDVQQRRQQAQEAAMAEKVAPVAVREGMAAARPEPTPATA